MSEQTDIFRSIGALEAVTKNLEKKQDELGSTAQKNHTATHEKLDALLTKVGHVENRVEENERKIDGIDSILSDKGGRINKAIEATERYKEIEKKVWYALGGGSIVLGTGAFATNKFWAFIFSILNGIR
jgi:peptidoglycan hydrolase CwlO-like protein